MEPKEFKREYLQQWPDDKEYRFYLDAWLVYHRAASCIDGHIRIPRNSEEQRTVSKAGNQGHAAQLKFMRQAGFPDRRDVNKEKWQRAKMESLRIIDHEGQASE